jgi:aspartate racemase
MKTVGIIGGMGPEATNHLILKIISLFEKSGQKNRPSILADFVPVGVETESDLILHNLKGDFAKLLINSAKTLEKSGVDFIIIACNSVHIFVEDVRKSVDIPVISVLDEVEKLKLKSVGILATNFTLRNKLFKFDNLCLNKPRKITQIALNQTIDCLVKGRVVDNNNLKLIEKEIDGWVQNGINTCILGCSEMQLLTSMWSRWSTKIKFVDTMDVLAQEAVNNLLN